MEKYAIHVENIKCGGCVNTITTKLNKEYEIKSIPKKTQEKWQREIEKLQQDAKKSAKLLKVKNVKFYDFPDNEMDGIHLLKWR